MTCSATRRCSARWLTMAARRRRCRSWPAARPLALAMPVPRCRPPTSAVCSRVVSGSLDIGAFQTQAANSCVHDAWPDRRRGPADGCDHGRAGRPGRQPGPGGQRRSDRLAVQQLNGRQLLVSERPYPSAAGMSSFRRVAVSATFDYTDTQSGTPTLTASAAGFGSATQQETILPAPIAVHARHRHRRRPDALRLFHGRRAEQPGDHHLHGLQPASRLDHRRAADRYPGAGRDVGERLAATGPERAKPGLEPGHD